MHELMLGSSQIIIIIIIMLFFFHISHGRWHARLALLPSSSQYRIPLLGAKTSSSRGSLGLTGSPSATLRRRSSIALVQPRIKQSRTVARSDVRKHTQWVRLSGSLAVRFAFGLVHMKQTCFFSFFSSIFFFHLIVWRWLSFFPLLALTLVFFLTFVPENGPVF